MHIDDIKWYIITWIIILAIVWVIILYFSCLTYMFTPIMDVPAMCVWMYR